MHILTARWPGLALVLSLSSMMWLPIGWAKGPSLPPPSSLPPPLFSQCESHGRLSALAVRKMFGRDKTCISRFSVKHCEQTDHHPTRQQHMEKVEAIDVLHCTTWLLFYLLSLYFNLWFKKILIIQEDCWHVLSTLFIFTQQLLHQSVKSCDSLAQGTVYPDMRTD